MVPSQLNNRLGFINPGLTLRGIIPKWPTVLARNPGDVFVAIFLGGNLSGLRT